MSHVDLISELAEKWLEENPRPGAPRSANRVDESEFSEQERLSIRELATSNGIAEAALIARILDLEEIHYDSYYDSIDW